jgi:hypothetical protein
MPYEKTCQGAQGLCCPLPLLEVEWLGGDPELAYTYTLEAGSQVFIDFAKQHKCAKLGVTF